jgi:acyl-coenzyme A synthetase/AMP-(fatty) acid ligase
MSAAAPNRCGTGFVAAFARIAMTPSDPPEYFNFAEDVVGKLADQHPQETALLSVSETGNETRWSFGLLQERSSRLAHLLLANGLGRGGTVLVMVGSFPHRVIALLAVMKAGGVSLLVRQGTSSRELRHHLDRAAPALAVAGPEGAEQFPPRQKLLIIPSQELEHDLCAVPPRFDSLCLRSDEPAQIMLTGGTTGLPKMVLHTHGSKLFHYLRWTLTFDPDDLSWDFAGRWWMGAWRHGTPVFDRAMPARGPETPGLVLEMLSRYPITRLMATPRMYRELLSLGVTNRSFAKLRCCWSSGQALDSTVYRAWKKATGMTLHDRYNQSECGEAPLQYPEGTTWKPGCIGKPFPWIGIAIIDRNGQRLPPGKLGDIAIKVKPVRPPSLFREYWKDPEATAARHRGDWYLTGDIGRTDQAGFFFIAGRADDVINCGGENIGPYELESVLLEHAAVREAAVIGKPDRDLGEVPKAFVVLESSFKPCQTLADELMQCVNEAIHPFKRLREVEFTDTLPTTGAGKVSRRELRHAPHLGHR